MTTQTTVQHAKPNFLRRAVQIDGAFSATSGAISLLGATPLASLMGLPNPLALTILGGGLIVYGLFLMVQAARAESPRRLAILVMALNILWVIGSMELLYFDWVPLTTAGTWIVIAIADIVGLLAVLQFYALQKEQAHITERFEVARLVDAPAKIVWQVISDLEGYAEVAPNLSKAKILSGAETGAQRQCWDTQGGTWRETCIMWDEGRGYAFEVDTSDYPYPFTKMQGTWSLTPEANGTRITMRFDYRLKGGLLGAWLGQLTMKPKFRPICEKLLDNWQARIEDQVAAGQHPQGHTMEPTLA